MTQQHPTAIIHPTAILADDVVVGPYAIIESHVQIGAGSRIGAHTYIDERTVLGEQCRIAPHVSLGTPPQDLRYTNEPTRVVIGDNVQIREFVTVNRGTGADTETVVGDGCMLMSYAHVAHNCHLGKGVILANAVQLGGHIQVGDFAFLGGIGAFHQHIRIGRMAMVSGLFPGRLDIPPFAMMGIDPEGVRGINTLGLRRQGVNAESRMRIKHAYRLLWHSSLPFPDAMAEVERTYPEDPYILELLTFIRASKRGVFRMNTDLKSLAKGSQQADDVCQDPVAEYV